MAKPALPAATKPNKSSSRTLFAVCLWRRMMYRALVARLQFTDDLILRRKPAGNDLEFDPPLEGEAADKLLMANTRAGSLTRRTPDLHRRRLPSRVRHRLPARHSRCGWISRRAPIAFASGFKA